MEDKLFPIITTNNGTRKPQKRGINLLRFVAGGLYFLNMFNIKNIPEIVCGTVIIQSFFHNKTIFSAKINRTLIN